MARATVQGRHRFDVEHGHRVLLVGPNGSGKTSLLRALAGLEPWTDVAATLDGEPLVSMPAAHLARSVAAAWQAPRDALVGLTVAGEFGMRRRAVAHDWLERCAREVATLSSGEARRLSLVLVEGHPLLLLDEPMEGLDMEGQASLRALLHSAPAAVFTDHTGLLHDLATHVVHTGPLEGPTAPVLPPPPPGPLMVEGPAHHAAARGVRLPALALGPGLHAVIGPNASGKSTLLMAVAGRLPPDRGSGPSGAGGAVQARDGPPPQTTAPRMLTPYAADQLVHQSVAQDLADAEPATVAALVPSHLLDRHPLALSGGEAQRVALAKVLGSKASVLLLDEPEAHLDPAGRAALWGVLARRIGEGRCILAATHDAETISAAHTTVRMGGP